MAKIPREKFTLRVFARELKTIPAGWREELFYDPETDTVEFSDPITNNTHDMDMSGFITFIYPYENMESTKQIYENIKERIERERVLYAKS